MDILKKLEEMRKMGAKANFILSIVALVIAIVGCTPGVWIFFQPAPLTEEKAPALFEERTKTYITEERPRKIIEQVVAGLKLVTPEEGKKE